MNAKRLVAVGLLAALSCDAPALAAETHYALRGYREFSEIGQPNAKAPVEMRSFVFESPERAQIFASKIYSDYTLTVGNKFTPLMTAQGPVDAISIGGKEMIVPLVAHDAKRVDVLIGSDATAVTARANELLHGPALLWTEMGHPLFMDKWDRYCMGIWNRIGDVLEDPTNKTLPSYYGWLAQIGWNPQLVDATTSDDLTTNDNLLRLLRKYFKAEGTKYQNVEWLQAYPDLYNRNPFLSSFDGPGTMTKWDYYGETPHAPGLLRDVQHAPLLEEMRDFTKDAGLMAILDPDGEVGPFPYFKWGEYGPVQTRNFVRYLKEERHYSLADVSKRYYGRADALKSWNEVTLADWRTFYGWDDKSVDLQGEWRVMREGDSPGVREGWQSPDFDDSDWVRLTYPGDTTLFTLTDNTKPLWMRRTLTVDASKFAGPIYLSVAPLCERPVQVYVNGKRVGILTPRFHTARIFGQFDVTQLVRANPKLTVALRFDSNDQPNGPVFLTDKPLEDFPTHDPLLNARRYDHFDFIDWAVGDSVGSMLKQIRSVDPDRPIKVHAFDSSAWGYKITAENGGYSHHTGAGAGWAYTVPKQYDFSRGTQDSAETGGSQETPRNIKGLIGNLIFMGKNAHDYFYNAQDITKDPAVLAWWVKRLPDMRLMGRENADSSSIASLRGLRSTHYVGEFYHTENWRFTYNLTKGGEMVPLLDELRVGEGHLPYPAIIDEGTIVWDEAMTAQLKKYVEDGGTLFLEAASGLHTPTVRDAHPAAELAGVTIGADATGSAAVTMTVADPILGNQPGDGGSWGEHIMSPPHQITAQPGTEVIGTANGQPAITRRKLGKGTVYYCAGGIWPAKLCDAIRDHFAPPVYATVDGKGVDMVRTARSNNGSEDLLMLRGLGGKPATVHWTFDYTPEAIYNPVTGETIPAKIDGHTATFDVNIEDWDFAWYAARRPDAREQFSHWLTRQTEMWNGLVKPEPAPKPPLFRTLDLNHGWTLAQTDSLAAAQALMAKDDRAAGLKPTDLGWWSAPGTGLKHGPGVFGLYRRDFKLPAGWEKNATFTLRVDGRVYQWPQAGFGGPSTIYLNGKQIWTGEKIEQESFDLSTAIKPGSNRLEIVHEGEGILAAIELVRTINPDTTIDLSGDWQAVDGPQAVRTVRLPGKVKTSFVYRDVVIPKEQAGREVWLRVASSDVNSSRAVIVNGRCRYPVTRADNARPLEVNITPEIRFGEPNRILISAGSMGGGWQLGTHEYQKLELGFYAPGRWTGDPKGISGALTPREREAVAAQEARVQLFPLVQNAVTKPALNLFPFTPADAQAYAPPAPAINLDLTAAGGVTDRGSSHATVQVEGKTAPFHERNGAVAGLELFGEGETKADLLLPDDAMRPLLAGKSFTIGAWIKPMLDKDIEGDFAQWGLALDWTVAGSNTQVTWNDKSSPRLIAGALLSPRQWHYLALSVDGKHVTLYVDGLNVADQEFDAPLNGGNTPFVIGGTLRFPHFLHMKLATFSVYPQALDDDSIGKLFVKDREKYQGAPGSVWPEDALARLAFAADGVKDVAEFPATLVLGPGTTPQMVDGAPALDFDGKTSSILFKENGHVRLVGAPFSMIWDFKPAVGAEGCVFRRTFNPGLWLRKDGTLHFDANSGENNNLDFPNAVTMGQWNRIMLTFDGKTVSLFRDGKQIVHRAYVGSLDNDSNHLFCVGADPSTGNPEFVTHLAMQLREFTIYPGVLDTVPAPAPASK